MDNLIFSLNATVPIFLLMVLGLFFRKLNWIDEEFATKMNAFVFRVPLPVMLFADLAKVDFKSAWNGKFVLFCFIATLLSIILVALFSLLWKDKTIQGEFIQASYRSSAAHSRYCIYSKYIRQYRYGSAYDYRKRSSL